MLGPLNRRPPQLAPSWRSLNDSISYCLAALITDTVASNFGFAYRPSLHRAFSDASSTPRPLACCLLRSPWGRTLNLVLQHVGLLLARGFHLLHLTRYRILQRLQLAQLEAVRAPFTGAPGKALNLMARSSACGHTDECRPISGFRDTCPVSDVKSIWTFSFRDRSSEKLLTTPRR